MLIDLPMKRFVFVFLTLALGAIFLSGCTTVEQPDSIDVEKIKAMVGDQEVKIDSKALSLEEIKGDFFGLNQKCGGTLVEKPYTLVRAVSSKVDVEIFVDEGSKKIVCTIRASKETAGCLADADCDDGLLSTIDKCDSALHACSNERIQECVSGDSFCPNGCRKETDSDCKNECVSGPDCNDQNVSTSDSCTGLIKTCVNSPIFVGGRLLTSCETSAQCDASNPCTIDSCGEEKTCSFSNEINGAVCGLKKECYESACVDNSLNKITISNVQLIPASENSVEISWKTNKLGNSKVKYGLDVTLQQSMEQKENAIDHKIVLENLFFEKKYFYKIESLDLAKLGVAVHESFTPYFFTCKKCENGGFCDISGGDCVLK